MPQVVAWAATAITAATTAVAGGLTAVGLSATAATATATFAVNAAAQLALSTAATALLAPQVNAEGSPTEWVADPDAPIPFAAGRVGVAGRIIHRDEYGPNNMYQTVVTVLSGAGPINAFISYKGDDQAVTFNGSGMATTSQWANEMWMQYRLGLQPETAHTSPSGLTGSATLPSWGSTYKLSGKASAMLTMGENSKHTAYPTGEPKPVWVIEGLKGYDPRLDSTYPGGSGSCRLATPSTWVYITNPILWALKWALGLWEGPTGQGAPGVDYQVGGLGVPVGKIDVAAFVEAANVADANGWTTSAWPTTDDDKSQVMDAFLQAGGAIYASKAGLVSCIHRAAARTSIVTITAADTAGPLEIDTAARRIGRINTIRPRFWSEDNRWQMTAIDEVTSSTWQTEDGGKRTRGVDFPYVPDATQAAQLAALQIANTREGITGKIPLKPYLQNLNPGDAFTITEEGFVLNGLKCLCLTTEYDPATGIHTVGFVSETDSKYAFALGQSATAPSPPTLTPVDPTTVSAPDVAEWSLAADLLVVDGAYVPALVVTGSVENARATQVLWEYRIGGTSDWTLAGSDGPEVERKVITGISSGEAYEVAVSYRVGSNTSTRLVLGPESVGDTTAPGPVTSPTVTGVLGAIVLEWVNPTDADFDLVRIYRFTANTVGSAVFVGEARADSYRAQVPLASTDYYFWAATVDRTGNEGTKTLLGGDQALPVGDLAGADDYDWVDLTGRPTELTDGRVGTGFDSSGVLQTAIPSALADTSNILRRTSGGLFTGSLSATAGATWGVDVGSRPAELTDGRITTALDSSGVLQTNIPSALATSSDLLRRTGGGLFTGALAATAGATWGVDVGSRPAELTDGRIAAGLASNGDVARNLPSGILSGSNIVTRAGGGGVYTGDLDATNDAAVTDLQSDLLSGAVKPAESVTFTGKGDLATKNTANTADLVTNAVTSEGVASTSAEVDIITIGTTRATVQEITRTVTGQPVTINANFYLWAHHGDDDWDLRIVVERLVGSTTTDVYDSGDLRCLTTNGDGFIIGWQTLQFTDTPPAGSVVYSVRVYTDRGSNFNKFAYRSRFLAVREFKR